MSQPRPASARGTAVAVGSRRDPFFDNAKLLLIALVVVGHDWYPMIGDVRAAKAAYLLVYAFHIPAFVLLSGYFSRGFEGRPKQWRKLVVGVLVPYLIFQTAYAAEAALLGGKPFALHLSSPIYVCWFLLSLFVWRASAPLWRSLPQPLLISAAVSLAAGVTVVSTAFALSRTLQLLPWFVLGLLLHRRHFVRLRRPGMRIAAAVVLAVAAAVAYLVAPGADVRWLDREWDAAELHVPVAVDLLVAGGLQLVTLVLVAAALALVPRSRTWLTALGALTMYPFLLHGLVVRIAQHAGVHDALTRLGVIGAATVAVGAVLLTLLLTTRPVRLVTGWAVEPGRWLRSRRPSGIPPQERPSAAPSAPRTEPGADVSR